MNEDSSPQNSTEPGDSKPSNPKFRIVGIGASAGGLEALEQLFDNIPNFTGMAFVVVQHLSPDFKSLMGELLARHTKMPIHRAENNMVVEPNRIYLIPPKKNMVLSEGRLLLSEQDSSGGLNLPIDIFLRSLAQDIGNRAIGVILSGTGSDGSRGIQDIHEAGGIVAVQTYESAGFDGMPRNAMATGMADVVASPAEMPNHLLSFVRDPEGFSNSIKKVDEPILPGQEFHSIMRLLRTRYGIDFTSYREGTIQRRIERRMQLLHCIKLIDYVQMLRSDSEEVENLYRDLLVEVTEFFRDPKAFDRIRNEVVPSLLDSAAAPDAEIRVWVAGCATGEEAYSIAMCLHSEAANRRTYPSIKVFATDVHRNSLEAGSAGVYTAESLANVPTELRQRYFTQHGTLFHVNPELRKLVIFAPHNLANDPPFTRIDLVSCRNVLIYLKPEIQKRVLSLFHFGMRAGGYLLLGSSETLGDLSIEFETVDQHWRIFRKLRNIRLRDAIAMPMSPPIANVISTPAATLMSTKLAKDSNSFWDVVLEDLLDRYVPPSFLMDRNHELIHTFGDAHRILKHPKGKSSLHVLKMVEGDLRMALSTAIHRAARENSRVVLQGVRVDREGEQVSMQVSVEPYTKKSQDLFLVSLEEMKDRVLTNEPQAEAFRPDDQSARRIMELEQELEFKTESLQTTVEELESSNEELQSTNEELVASNEELQSTNEELHSVNEELYTVNAEHQRKIEELTQLTADMDNLIRSTEIGTIFLDRDLRIRRFTPAISAAFHILEQDIGRPISQFAYHFENPDWIDNARLVIESGEAMETEIRMNDGSTFLKRMSPFRLATGVVDGLVITFTDVSLVTRAQEMEARRQHLERVTQDLQEFVYAVSHDLQSPLRHLDESFRCLEESYQSIDQSAIDEELVRIRGYTKALKTMLQGLLMYSRVNTRGNPIEAVDANAILRSACSKLDPMYRDAEAQLTYESLPTLLADTDQLETVFWHLLDNALKYRSDDRKLQVHVTVQSIDDECEIRFSDNGIGIRQQHFEEIFTIFRRLEFKPEVDGWGVGLALCRRIAERHHASLRVESEVDKGSTFILRWPR